MKTICSQISTLYAVGFDLDFIIIMYFNPLTLASNCPRPAPNSLAFPWNISRQAKSQKWYAQYSQAQDLVSRHCLFKVEWMKGQNIKNINKKNSTICKIDEKTFKKLYFFFAVRQRQQQKLEFLPMSFTVISLITCTNCSKSWMELWSNTVQYHFSFLMSRKLL